MKILFLGSPQIALPLLSSLIEHHTVVGVITQPDKKAGRKQKFVSTEVAKMAESHGIPLFKPRTAISQSLYEELKNLDADIFVMFAFGLILTEPFLSITPQRGINVHPSLLPLYRGASPLQSALLDGKTQTGITIQTVEAKVDAGKILSQKVIPISPDDDVISLENKVALLAPELVLDVLEKLETGSLTPLPQNDSEATYCHMFSKEDGKIDWNEPADSIINKIKAFARWPVAYSYFDGEMVRFYKGSINTTFDFADFSDTKNGQIVLCDMKNGLVVKASDALINLEQLQKQGKKVLNCKDYVNGCRDVLNRCFT